MFKRKKLSSNFWNSSNILVANLDENYKWDKCIYLEYEKVDETKCCADLFLVCFMTEEKECLLIWDKNGAEVLMQKPSFINRKNVNNFFKELKTLKITLLQLFISKHIGEDESIKPIMMPPLQTIHYSAKYLRF